MTTNFKRIVGACFVSLVVLVSLATPAPAPAGPIGDMLARHRTQRRVQLPPVEKPFNPRPIKDISSVYHQSRFMKRFSPSAGAPNKGVLGSMFPDSSVTRTSAK